MDEKGQQELQIQDNLSRIKNRIMVLSGKGGVGKSFVAVNIAFGLALQGKRVGILDADIHGPSVAKLTNIENIPISKHQQSGLASPVKAFTNLQILSVASLLSSDSDALIWRGPLKMALIKQFFSDFYWEELDYLIIDCPPGTGDEPLSVKQVLERVDGAVIVTTPQDISILDVKKSVDFIQKIDVPILGVIENMKHFRCPHCGEVTVIFEGSNLQDLLQKHSLELLAELEIDPLISKSGDEGKPYIYYYNKQSSAEKLMQAVHRIIEKIEC